MNKDGCLYTVILSIHAPREGSDVLIDNVHVRNILLSIHAPREGSDILKFGFSYTSALSIHAAREGSDIIIIICQSDKTPFNPRSPRRERPSGFSSG